MQIFVKCLDEKTITLDVELTTSIAEVKSKVMERKGIPYQLIYLSYGGKRLRDESSLADYNIGNHHTLYLVSRLLGGIKKRKKKKNYTTPKKIKHSKKKVKLATLNFYKIDDNGKIHRLRRECVDCGAGVFMAAHHDRYYCGKCHLTLVFNKSD